MRIAVYSGEIPSSTFVETLIIGLANKGHQLFIFGIKKKSVNYDNANVNIIATPTSKLFSFFFVCWHWLLFNVKNGSEKQLLTQILSEKNFPSFKYKFWFLAEVLPILNNKPEVFHVQWIKGGIVWDFLPKFGIKLVGSFRGSHINYTPIIDPEYKTKYLEAFPKFTAFHAVSQRIAQESLQYGSEMNKITVIPGAVNPDLIKDPINVVKGKKLKVLSVGRFHWVKGYNYMLDACKVLKDKGIDFEYTIVGGVGAEELPFQRLELGLEDEVKFIDRLNHTEVLKLYKGYDLYVLPSLSEGIANVVLEAMAIGLPVISTDCGGMSEVIKHKVNGWLIPFRNPEAIVNAILEYKEMSDDEILFMCQKARHTIIQNHLIPQQIAKFDELYKSMA